MILTILSRRCKTHNECGERWRTLKLRIYINLLFKKSWNYLNDFLPSEALDCTFCKCEFGLGSSLILFASLFRRSVLKHRVVEITLIPNLGNRDNTPQPGQLHQRYIPSSAPRVFTLGAEHDRKTWDGFQKWPYLTWEGWRMSFFLHTASSSCAKHIVHLSTSYVDRLKTFFSLLVHDVSTLWTSCQVFIPPSETIYWSFYLLPNMWTLQQSISFSRQLQPRVFGRGSKQRAKYAFSEIYTLFFV